MKLKRSYFGFQDQGSLVQLRKWSIMPDAKTLEMEIRPLAGFSGDKVLSGWKNNIKRRKIVLPIDSPDRVKELRSDRLYPVMGKGIIGSVSGNVRIVDISSGDPYYRRLKIAEKRILELELMVHSLTKTNEFLSQPAQKQINSMIQILKEAKKLTEPASMEYFQYTAPMGGNQMGENDDE